MIKRVLLTIVILFSSLSMIAQMLDLTSVERQAHQGDTKSMYIYSYYSIYGVESGISKNYAEAVSMLQKLVEKTPATDYVIMGYKLLGDCCENGIGIAKNITKAKEWWQKAANYGNVEAQTKLDVYSTVLSFQNTSESKKNFTTTINGVSFTMIYIEGGTFQMGSNDSDALPDENPVHSVTLNDYYIGETEVTQELWEAVMGDNPSRFKGSNNPVEKVTWNECQYFINKLNEMTGKNFCLPTEAQWEYAARGGKKSRGYKYSGSNTIDDVAWYSCNTDSGTEPVGTKAPNELGLYDMSGNVCEWCSDCYSMDYYTSISQSNPTGPSADSYWSNRVLRSGSWASDVRYCRVTFRYGDSPRNRVNGHGLRLALRP